MPVLLLEPFVFPPDLLSEPTLLSADESARWWVLHTRPRAEKAVARALVNREIPFFFPLSRKCRNARGRIIASYLPLFPGYVFLFGNSQQRLKALETNTIVSTLFVPDQQRLGQDLARIYHLMASGASLVPEEQLQPGMWVEISAGPLMGMRGRILRRANRLRFVVEVDFLRRGASVEVDEAMITPAEPSDVPCRLCA